MTDNRDHLRPVIFGEVLYDIFPDRSTVLGGAPFNVAWHLHGLGLAPLFISRVGNDKLGERILHAMEEWGMDTYGVTRDPLHPTGRVQVSLDHGQPGFDIVPDVAYDHINPESVEKLYTGSDYGMLYHGSLISRLPVSRQSLHLLRNSAPSIFVDINLRAPWWGEEVVDELLQGISWLKINDDELQTLSGGVLLPGDQAIETEARKILEKYTLQAVIVTRGAEGAMLIDSESSLRVEPSQVGRLVDTVGAGDGFSAVWIAGLLKNWNKQVILERAVQFAAAICRLRGAVTQDRDFYRQYRHDWSL